MLYRTGQRSRAKKAKHTLRRTIVVAAVGLVVFGAGVAVMVRSKSTDTQSAALTPTTKKSAAVAGRNPLANRTFYVDTNRSVNRAAAQYKKDGNKAEAKLLEKIANQPAAIWLVGPSVSDPTAQRDIATVTRTSTEAKKQGTLPVYQLYAVPGRDACADYSKGGFADNAAYLNWIDSLVAALKTQAVFSVEADAVAQTITSGCMSQQKIAERFQLLSQTIERLQSSPNVLATYLDAGHSEWFPDPAKLVEPLKRAGVDKATGIAVNVSNFVATPDITLWGQQLVRQLGGNKGIVIDTSRNGKGSAPKQVTGDARWCNPVGRGTGRLPTTDVADADVDAYFWIKAVGESDGACFGNAPAGTFMPQAAIDLARNAEE